MEITYKPPEILAEMDDDAIHDRMLAAIPDDVDKTEGGFAHDFTRPAALEKAELMVAINDVVQIFFPEWSYSGWLDRHADKAGLKRRSARPAETALEITGVPGTVIPSGFLLATPQTAIADNVEFAVVDPKTISAEGKATVVVRCTEAGRIGNVPANSITLMSSPIAGITLVTNPLAATGGVEAESDDALRERIIERERGETSFVGNDSDYKRWAREVDGVGSVAVVPEWQGAGSGTVKLIVMDANGEPANSSILTAVYDHIISPDDRDHRLAPIGAILTVVTAETVGLTVSAKVMLEDGVELDNVNDDYRKGLLAYFVEAKAENCIRYTRIGSVLSETAGVLDYTELSVNGGTANVDITVDDYPTIAAINLTEAS